MKATATTRAADFRHTVKVREHHLSVDEPGDEGGDDAGPSPQELLAASLASCTAITMEMYAERKGWDIGGVEVDVRVHARRARLPDALRPRPAPARRPHRRAGRAPARHRRQVPGAPHARRRGHVRRACRARRARELSLARAAARRPARPRRGGRSSTSTAAPTPPCSSRCSSRDGELHAVLTAPPRRPAPPRGRDLVPRRAPGRRRGRPARDRAARGRTRRSACPPTPSSWSARCSRRRRSPPTTRSIRSSG